MRLTARMPRRGVSLHPGRSSDFRFFLAPAPSHPIQWDSGSCRFRPRLQRRDHAGLAPASLLCPIWAPGLFMATVYWISSCLSRENSAPGQGRRGLFFTPLILSPFPLSPLPSPYSFFLPRAISSRVRPLRTDSGRVRSRSAEASASWSSAFASSQASSLPVLNRVSP